VQGFLILVMLGLALATAIPFLPSVSALDYGVVLHALHVATAPLCLLAATQVNADLFRLTFYVYTVQLLVDTVVATLVLIGLFLNPGNVLPIDSAFVFGAAMSAVFFVLSLGTWAALLRVYWTLAIKKPKERALAAHGPLSAGGPWETASALAGVMGYGGVVQGVAFGLLAVLAAVLGIPFLPATTPTFIDYGVVLHIEHAVTWALCVFAATQASAAVFYTTFALLTLQVVADLVVMFLVLASLFLNINSILTVSGPFIFGLLTSMILAILSVVMWLALRHIYRALHPATPAPLVRDADWAATKAD
jgi:hypothetical protein